MTKEDNSNEEDLWEEFYSRILLLVKENKRAWQSFGVVFAFVAGAFSFIAAMICNLIALLLASIDEVHFFNRVSFVFFVMFLPLMISGAHFLDLLEKKYFNL